MRGLYLIAFAFRQVARDVHELLQIGKFDCAKRSCVWQIEYSMLSKQAVENALARAFCRF